MENDGKTDQGKQRKRSNKTEGDSQQDSKHSNESRLKEKKNGGKNKGRKDTTDEKKETRAV